MNTFHLNREMVRLVILQRIELLSLFTKKIRKLFGRYIFGNIIAKYFFNSGEIGKKYFYIMEEEFNTIKDHVNFDNKKILAIGGGMGGFESFLNKKFNNNFYSFVEKNFISKKVKYGWDNENKEAYNNLDLLKIFLLNNEMKESQFEIFDYDKDNLPIKNFDLIISLFSLDYHYDFNIYIEYFKKVSTKETKIIFDTIRPDHYLKVFKNIKILKNNENTIHKSKRIMCSEFIK